MAFKEILSAIAIVITFVAFFPYIRLITQGKIQPHVFSWVVWGATTCVVFFAQLDGRAGVGAWPTGVSGLTTIIVACLAYYKRSDLTITKVDWAFFISAMSSIPIWYFMSDPLWAVIILTSVDLLGFAPTVRKSYTAPHSESLLFFSLFTTRNLIVVMALEHYSVTTVLFPAAIAIACILLMVMITFRRKALST